MSIYATRFSLQVAGKDGKSVNRNLLTNADLRTARRLPVDDGKANSGIVFSETYDTYANGYMTLERQADGLNALHVQATLNTAGATGCQWALPCVSGQKVTVSMLYKGDAFSLVFSEYDGNYGWLRNGSGTAKQEAEVNGWKRKAVTYTPTDANCKTLYVQVYNAGKTVHDYTVYHPKAEYGDVATDFVLSDEDARVRATGDNLLRNADFHQTADILGPDGKDVLFTLGTPLNHTMSSDTYKGYRYDTFHNGTVDFYPMVEANGVYTLSFYYQYRKGASSRVYVQGIATPVLPETADGEWGQFVYTFKKEDSGYRLLRFYVSGSDTTFRLCQPKLERGIYDTPFSLHQEDLRGEGADALFVKAEPSAVVWSQNDDGETDSSGIVTKEATWPSYDIDAHAMSGGTDVSKKFSFSYSITGGNYSVTKKSSSNTDGSQTFTLSSPRPLSGQSGMWLNGGIKITATPAAGSGYDKLTGTIETVIPIMLNAVGTWHMTVKGDVMTATSEKTEQQLSGVTSRVSTLEQSSAAFRTEVNEQRQGRNMWLNGDLADDTPPPTHNKPSGDVSTAYRIDYTDDYLLGVGKHLLPPAGFGRFMSFTSPDANKGVYWKNTDDGQRFILPTPKGGTAPTVTDADYCLSFWAATSVAAGCQMVAGLENVAAAQATVTLSQSWQRLAVYIPKGTDISAWTRAVIFYPTAAVMQSDKANDYGRVFLTGIQWEAGTRGTGAPTPWQRGTLGDFQSLSSSITQTAKQIKAEVRDEEQAAGVTITSKGVVIEGDKVTINGDMDLRGNLILSTRLLDGVSYVGLDLKDYKSVTMYPNGTYNPLVCLPLLTATAMYGSVSVAAFDKTKNGLQLSVTNAYDPDYGQWMWGAAQTMYTDGTTNRRYLYNRAVIICADPRTLSYKQWASNAITSIMGKDFAADPQGFFACKGKLGKYLAILPGQTARLTASVQKTHPSVGTGTEYLIWTIDNGDEFVPLRKQITTYMDTTTVKETVTLNGTVLDSDNGWAESGNTHARMSFFGPAQFSDDYLRGSDWASYLVPIQIDLESAEAPCAWSNS